MVDKKATEIFLIKNLRTPGANILKQDALSIGAELAVPKMTITCEAERVDAVLMCSKKQLKELIKKEKLQPFGLKKLANELEGFVKFKSHPLKIMGVLNINEDSFYEKSRVEEDEVLKRALKMVEEGADIIDIGGVSSRPGSKAVSWETEMERVKPVIDILFKNKIHKKVKLSIDSYTPKVIEYALKNGFSIVNDITGLENDEVCKVAAAHGAEVCIMHMDRDPETMQKNPVYDDVVLDIKEFFKEQIEKAKKFGIEKIVLDVGIGFGKTLEHNIELLNHQEDFLTFGYPVLIGASRKSMIGKISSSSPEQRLGGTLVIHFQAVENGASIVRCHDVPEHAQAFKVLQKIKGQGLNNLPECL